MDRLAIIITLFGAHAVAGALITAAFSLGYFSAWAVVLAALIGLAVALPTGFYISRLIKREDPAWDSRRDAPKKGLR